MKFLKTTSCLVLISMLVSCGAAGNLLTSSNQDSENTLFSQKADAQYGHFNKTHYKKVIDSIKTALEVSLPERRPIFINYRQDGSHCEYADRKEVDVEKYANRLIKVSSDIGAQNNAITFFVYTKTAPNSIVFQRLPSFVADKGYFYNQIFILHQKCSGFFILKPNGDYIKYYGDNYCKLAENFLTTESSYTN